MCNIKTVNLNCYCKVWTLLLKNVVLESISACVILMCYKKRQELPENVIDKCQNV
jgi:hypothetical protein